MSGRAGPFWDAVQGRVPLPPAAATLGLELVDADVAAGTIELAFAATQAFTNPVGNVLGAFQAAGSLIATATATARVIPHRPPGRRRGRPGAAAAGVRPVEIRFDAPVPAPAFQGRPTCAR